MGRNYATKFGYETFDEMCITTVWYIRPVNGSPISCHSSSPLWTGELSPDEDAFGLQHRHPSPTGYQASLCNTTTTAKPTVPTTAKPVPLCPVQTETSQEPQTPQNQQSNPEPQTETSQALCRWISLSFGILVT